MNIATIDDLAYLIKQAKQEGLPKPIVFLGAGASKTGGVPLASEIITDILLKYKDKPNIKLLKEEDKTYSNLMTCLTPFERNKLLKKYIDEAKINVTHIYLAQLIINGYVDYVLTVNFDNLMLRALALFNEFPPTYDMAILKDLTTTSFKEKSVVYLHGQHHGLWLLNTKEEMGKVKEMIPPILSSIKNQRVWIFIGYSGEDPIFEHITKLGRFDNGLYWISYNDNVPSALVCSQLLDKDNTNAFLIKGFDSDSFMLKLNNELNLQQPSVVAKPFSSLKTILENIVDIDDKEHFKGVKERLEIAKKDVFQAIKQFEEGNINVNKNLKEEIDINLLKKQIIEKIAKENFDELEIKLLEDAAVKLRNKEINEVMSRLFSSWGLNIKNLADLKNDESLYELSIEKYKKATELNPKYDIAFNNWGAAISNLADLKNDESLYELSIEKYKKATELNPKYDTSFYSWGCNLSTLASLRNDEKLYNESFEKFRIATELNQENEKAFANWGHALAELAALKKDETLYKQSFEKFRKATELNPKYDTSFYSWGCNLSTLASLRNDEKLYNESFEKFRIATELNQGNEKAFANWGHALAELAALKKDETLYKQSFEKFRKATELNPKVHSIFYSWGGSILKLAKLKNDKTLFGQSFKILTKGIELGGKSYNLACLYALQNEKVNALAALETSLKNKDIKPGFVKKDEDWKLFFEDADFIKLLEKYS